MPSPPFSSRPVGFHFAAGVTLCAVLGYAMRLINLSSQRDLEQTQQALLHVQSQQKAEGFAFQEPRGDMHLPAAWPERAGIDSLTQAMGELALVNGLALRTLSLSHGAPSEDAWGQVRLEVAASGRYADLKHWQGGLMAQFPSLAVQSLRLQPVAGNLPVGGVEAQVVWVFYVRD